MRKIISLFQRNYETDRLVRDEVVPGAEWVIAGEGVATRKWDGACCMIRDGRLYKRHELKAGRQAPAGFEAAQEPDPKTGSQPGWVVVGNGPEDKWFRKAMENRKDFYMVPRLADGTYEACGEHFGGGHHDKNPERCPEDILIPHGADTLSDFPRTFDAIREYFLQMPTGSIEGVVWHHPDGRMVKIKARDFGIRRGSACQTTI